MNKKFSMNSIYRNEIDGLRGIAVIAVILNHFNKNILPSGYLGVDIFFVISGYVITASLIKRGNDNFWDYISSFYERRIKRIIPLLSIFIISTSIFICMFNVYPIFNLRTGFASLIGLSNILLFKTSEGYFTNSSSLNPFTHTWSLSVEEQFYFIYPFLAWFTGFTRKKNYGSNFLSISLLILAIISLILFIYLYEINQNAAYFLMPPRFWEIAAGCLTFIGIYRNYKIIEIFKKINSNYLFVLLLSLFFLPEKNGTLATISAVIFTAFILISIKKENLSYKALTNKIVLKIGLMSYSLYLWHWGIISLSLWTIGINWWTIPFQIVIIFCISFLSYKYIEIPFINLDFNNRLQSYISGILFILISQSIIIYLGTNGKRLIFAGNNSGLYKRNIISKTLFFNQCNLTRKKFKNILINKNCFSKENFNKKRIIILGDSHANMFLKPFKNLVKNNPTYTVNNFSGNNCSFPVLKNSSLEVSKTCISEMEKAEIWIKNNLKPDDIVFLANNSFNKILFDYFALEERNQISSSIKSYLIRLNKFSRLINKKGGTVNFLVSVPVFNGVNGANCSIEWFRPRNSIKDNCFLNRDKIEEPRNKMINYLLLNKNKNTRLIHDYLDLICDSKVCSAAGYFDSNHITEDLGIKILINENLIDGS